jgi:hypothetical protein
MLILINKIKKFILDKLAKNQNIDGIKDRAIKIALIFIELLKNMDGIILNILY